MGFMSADAAFSSKDHTWRTPSKLFADLNAEFGFVLDVAAMKDSTLVPDNWYGPDHDDVSRRDALVMNWAEDANGGSIFMNPPYGRQIGKWMHKAMNESQNGSTIVCLVPSRTDTAWFWDTAFAAGTIRFIRGRLCFNDSTPAPFPSAVVIFGQ
jgi:phage N-6-adenine-methyltransferase